LDEGHGDELERAFLAEVVDPHHVAMADLAREQDLALEALERLRVRQDLRVDRLERDGAAEREIVRLVDHAAAALAEDGEDLVTLADPLAWREGRRARAPGGPAGEGRLVLRRGVDRSELHGGHAPEPRAM